MTDLLTRCSIDTPQKWSISSTNSEGDETLLNDELSYQNLHKVEDIESQSFSNLEFKDKPTVLPVAAEYTIPTQKKLIYLSVYFGLNLGLTLYNKALLGNVGYVHGSLYFQWLTTATVPFSLAPDSLSCCLSFARLLRPGGSRIREAHQAGTSGNACSRRIFFSLYNQHCHL